MRPSRQVRVIHNQCAGPEDTMSTGGTEGTRSPRCHARTRGACPRACMHAWPRPRPHAPAALAWPHQPGSRRAAHRMPPVRRAAESCARTSVRLEEMIQLLERLALEKIKVGLHDITCVCVHSTIFWFEGVSGVRACGCLCLLREGGDARLRPVVSLEAVARGHEVFGSCSGLAAPRTTSEAPRSSSDRTRRRRRCQPPPLEYTRTATRRGRARCSLRRRPRAKFWSAPTRARRWAIAHARRRPAAQPAMGCGAPSGSRMYT
jgi:hypothetical protein